MGMTVIQPHPGVALWSSGDSIRADETLGTVQAALDDIEISSSLSSPAASAR